MRVPLFEKHPYTSQWMFRSSQHSPDSAATIKSEKKFGPGEEHVILCSECGNPVTAPVFVITVNNRHRHTFINPAGITFQVGCFSSAPGCIVHGEPVVEHTWFTGFAWNYAICSNCCVHLGWYYQNNDNGFFGLILDSLVDSAGNH